MQEKIALFLKKISFYALFLQGQIEVKPKTNSI